MSPGIANPHRKVVALILSSVFLGLGQFYNRQPLKGALFLAVGVVLSWLVV
jgi:TM2 domain-containing membrane protein YozV